MRRTLLLSLTVVPGFAFAEVPRVVTDIPPVGAIAKRVMQGAGEPTVLVPPGASPHDYALRPSEARALAAADVVVWVGHGLTGFLEDPIEALSEDAAVLELMDAPLALLPYREGVSFDDHDHDQDHADHDDHDKEEGHDDHDHAKEEGHHDHDHAKEEGHDDHDHAGEEGHDDHAGHDHAGAVDPHLWLDPANAVQAAAALAELLGSRDPANAELYAANASAFAGEMTALEVEVTEILAPARGQDFIVLHDAFHYFEDAFEIEATGSVIDGEGSSPGARRLSALRATLSETQITCAFAEPQMNTSLIETAVEGQDVRIATLDPLGDGSDYAGLIRTLATSMADCLTGKN
ncbi:zinc ABC transporter substrate-binding protein [Sulfitobacter albidus]|nr:zinc ABC transporter substrate-binding protein [Sulfitobacter albidus]